MEEQQIEKVNGMELIQVPVIKHALKQLGEKVEKRIADLNIESQVVTEDTIQYLKKLTAELTKEFNDLESDRKLLKQAVMNPYDEVEKDYKAHIKDKYEPAIKMLRTKTGDFEIKIKENKKKELVQYFDELKIAEKVDFLNFSDLGIEVNLSTSIKQLKEKCNAFVSKINDDINLINTMNFSAEMMVEFKQNGFNSSLAITTVNKRKEQEKLEADRKKQAEIDRRQDMLRKLTMVYHDMTKAFHYVSDDTIFVTSSEISSLPVDQFNKVYVEIESKINKSKSEKLTSEKTLFDQNNVVEQKTIISPVIEEVKVEVVEQNNTPVITETLSAPVVEEVTETEQEFTASFEVTATMPKLMALKNYLIENNLNYKNI